MRKQLLYRVYYKNKRSEVKVDLVLYQKNMDRVEADEQQKDEKILEQDFFSKLRKTYGNDKILTIKYWNIQAMTGNQKLFSKTIKNIWQYKEWIDHLSLI